MCCASSFRLGTISRWATHSEKTNKPTDIIASERKYGTKLRHTEQSRQFNRILAPLESDDKVILFACFCLLSSQSWALRTSLPSSSFHQTYKLFPLSPRPSSSQPICCLWSVAFAVRNLKSSLLCILKHRDPLRERPRMQQRMKCHATHCSIFTDCPVGWKQHTHTRTHTHKCARLLFQHDVQPPSIRLHSASTSSSLKTFSHFLSEGLSKPPLPQPLFTSACRHF